MAPSNLNLPLELLHFVVEYLEPSAQDLSALSRTSRDLYACVTPVLHANRARNSQAILWAAETGHLPTMETAVASLRKRAGAAGVKGLMQEFSDPRFSLAPLSLAAKGNHARVAEFLLGTEGVNPMVVDREFDDTPLSWAAKNESLDVMRLLLADNRVFPDYRNFRGQNALFCAMLAFTTTTDAVEILLNDGRVELNIYDTSGLTLLALIAGKGDSAMARLVLNDDRVDVEHRDINGLTPLMYAASIGFLGMVELLIERGADVNALSWNHCSALVLAARSSHTDIVRLLLAQPGIELNRRGSERIAPLLYAAKPDFFDIDIFKMLVATEGVNVNVREHGFGDTPLLHATKLCRRETLGHEMSAALLACHKVDVNAKDSRGKTSLILAICDRNISLVREILRRNDVDLNQRDREGRTALMWAAQRKYLAAIKLLLAERDVGRAPHDLGLKDKRRNTALSIAAAAGWTAGVKAILRECSADVVNSRNCAGKTALSLAVENGYHSVVRAILARDDVDVNCRDIRRHTPLHLAVRTGNRPVVSIIRYLLAKPSLDVNSKDRNRKTALAMAIERFGSSASVVTLLVAHGASARISTGRNGI